MHLVKGHIRLRDGKYKCSCCGKNEYTAHVLDVCHDCLEESYKQDKQYALAMGVYKCDVCKESKSWWRRKFPKTARYYQEGRNLCKKHKITK